MENRKLSRRKFLQSAAGLVAAPMFIPSTVLGKDGGVAPSNRLTMAHIGVGGQGSYHLRIHSKRPDVQVVSVSDVDKRHMDKARETLNAAYGNTNGVKFIQDFREMLEDKDRFDAVLIAIPDHSHAYVTLNCLRAGKDVYCEKPLTRTIVEGRKVSDTVKHYGRILQTGSHERSNPKSRYVADLVRNGYLGKIHRVEVNMPVTSHGPIPVQQPIPAPGEFDYDKWLGPAPYSPYFYSDLVSPILKTNYQRCHFWFRYMLDYATGEMSDRGAHILDLVQMILDKDKTGPVEVSAQGIQHLDSEFDTFMEYEFDIKYDDGVVVHGTSKGDDDTRGLKVIGDNGWINVHIHGCALTASDPKLLDIKLKPSDSTIGRPVSHHDNFYDAIRTRGDVVAPAETGHRTASVCHITTIAMLLGRPLKWDPVKEQFIGDDDANRNLHYTYRAPYTL
jgi:predicted dehydrogenase